MKTDNHPFIDYAQYSLLLQDTDGETLDQITAMNKNEALRTARKCIKREWEKFGEKIQVTIIDNMNRNKPITLL